MDAATGAIRRKVGEMIKRPFNFTVGIFCGLCFVINIVNSRDAFDLCICAMAAAANIVIGLVG